MNFHKDILGTTVGIQSLALMGRAAKVAKKPNPKNFFGGFTDVLVGTALIKPTSSLVNSL